MMERLYVIKIGGNVIDEEQELRAFLKSVHALPGRKILVHGGGKIASSVGEKLDIQPNYIDGRRITDRVTIDLVTMVYGGLINKKIVALLQAFGSNAIGLTGADANVLPAKKRPVKTVDYGWVGDVLEKDIPVEMWKRLLEGDLLPVMAPLTHDGSGHMLNTNADTIASAVAIALSKEYRVSLLYCFEKSGILLNVADESSRMENLQRLEYEQLRADGRLFAGILPKLENAFAAVDAGVREVVIGHSNDLKKMVEGRAGTRIGVIAAT